MEIKDIFGNLPTLETERLVLRQVTLEDAPDHFEYASDSDVARYTTWQAHQSIEDSLNFLRSVLGRYGNQRVAPWGMVHKRDRKFIGTCGFLNWSVPDARAEIAYALSRKYWGQRLMTEAVGTIISFGFQKMQLNRIQAICEIENVASARVMEKVGMTFEGTLREFTFSKGHYRNLKMYAILRRDWESLGDAQGRLLRTGEK